VGGRLHHRIVDREIGVDEDTITRHFDVVENDEGVLLVEPARQRMIEPVGIDRDAVPAQKFETRRVHRNAERQRVRICGVGHGGARINGDLVGKGRERCQDARAAHDDAVLGVLNFMELDIIQSRRRIALVLSTVVWMMVWVRLTSLRVRCFWYLTRFAAPSSLPLTAHSSLRPAKPANVTFI
jgi:hypothetical protein